MCDFVKASSKYNDRMAVAVFDLDNGAVASSSPMGFSGILKAVRMKVTSTQPASGACVPILTDTAEGSAAGINLLGTSVGAFLSLDSKNDEATVYSGDGFGIPCNGPLYADMNGIAAGATVRCWAYIALLK